MYGPTLVLEQINQFVHTHKLKKRQITLKSPKIIRIQQARQSNALNSKKYISTILSQCTHTTTHYKTEKKRQYTLIPNQSSPTTTPNECFYFQLKNYIYRTSKTYNNNNSFLFSKSMPILHFKKQRKKYYQTQQIKRIKKNTYQTIKPLQKPHLKSINITNIKDITTFETKELRIKQTSHYTCMLQVYTSIYECIIRHLNCEYALVRQDRQTMVVQYIRKYALPQGKKNLPST
eukprot:TRINITY_DN16526_c0_g1_i8.p4 TRINITY_DN16526_c0_g1~~TRINITY_DN16526_c0_g1_i8.p4  ORF type:complete len:249 (+),score=-27.16 TRINITY_DN16526_c0_g1_i8:49-747(+)